MKEAWYPEGGSVVATEENLDQIQDWLQRRQDAAPGLDIGKFVLNDHCVDYTGQVKIGDLVENSVAWMSRMRLEYDAASTDEEIKAVTEALKHGSL